MNHLRIGIACYPTYGGSGVVATDLGIALANQGHEVHFLSYENPIRLTGYHGNVYYHQVGVMEYPLFKYPPYALALATQLVEVAEQHDLDLVHVHYAIPHSVSAALARDMMGEAAPRTVLTLHGTDITIVGNDPAYRRVTCYGIDHADGVTAVSTYLKDATTQTFGTTRSIEVIPNFIDLERFQVTPCPEAQSLRHGEERILMHVSNFRPVKRVPVLVEAFAQVAAELPSRLVLVGDGPDRPAAQALAAERGVADRVHFLGSQDAVEKILPCADLFVLPSEYESFGLAALEAMACGVPVVATRAGGLPEVVADGETGELCDIHEADCLVKVILRLLESPDQLAKMGREARRRVEREFSLDSILPRYEAFYRRVLESDSG